MKNLAFLKPAIYWMIPSIILTLIVLFLGADSPKDLFGVFLLIIQPTVSIGSLIHTRIKYRNINFDSLIILSLIFSVFSLLFVILYSVLVYGEDISEFFSVEGFPDNWNHISWIVFLGNFLISGIFSSFLPKAPFLEKLKNLFKVVLFVFVIFKIVQRLSKVQDVISGGFDTNGDGLTDTNFIDTDGDGVSDTIVQDTDGDGLIDTVISDTDGDGLTDTIIKDVNQDGIADLGFKDTDGDGKVDKII